MAADMEAAAALMVLEMLLEEKPELPEYQSGL
jgi:hypothetical protein